MVKDYVFTIHAKVWAHVNNKTAAITTLVKDLRELPEREAVIYLTSLSEVDVHAHAPKSFAKVERGGIQ